MKIAIGADFIGNDYKIEIIKHLKAKGHEIIDITPNELYPIVAFEVAKFITSKECERGILICGTGLGMNIAANKVKGIYSACVVTKLQAERASLSNNANIITLGCLNTSLRKSKQLIDTYLSLKFDKRSKSNKKIKEIIKYEEKI